MVNIRFIDTILFQIQYKKRYTVYEKSFEKKNYRALEFILNEHNSPRHYCNLRKDHKITL